MCNPVPDYELKSKTATHPTYDLILRLADEHRDVCHNIDRLGLFLEEGAPGASPKQVGYMRTQYTAMTVYAKCLNLRMKDLLDSMRKSSDSE